jgi:hypothetical protein
MSEVMSALGQKQTFGPTAANSGGPNDAERFRASKLDYQFELGDKLDGQLSDLVPLGSTQHRAIGG